MNPENKTANGIVHHKTDHSEETIFPILDEALFCTISYVFNNEPFAFPTSFVRIENQIYIHGSVGSHFLRQLSQHLPVCISIMIPDGIVIGKSAFHHSVNYRSVIIFSKGQPIDNYTKKLESLKKLTEKVVPGSWGYLRAVKESEINKTMIIAFEINEASAKIREGMANDDLEDLNLPVWSGVIPISLQKGIPIPDEQSKKINIPEHLK